MSDNKKELKMDDLEQVTGGVISDQKAYELALKHANVKNANLWKCERDTDDGIRVYEIEFYADGFKYEYDIDAMTGDILSYERKKKKGWD